MASVSRQGGARGVHAAGPHALGGGAPPPSWMPPDSPGPTLLLRSLVELGRTAGLPRVSAAGVMTHKYRGPIVVLSISKSVEPNKEQKEMTVVFSKVMSAGAKIVSSGVV